MKSILKLAVVLFLCVSCQAQTGNNQELKKKFTNYLGELENNQFSGSVLVAHKGKVITSGGYGFADKSANTKNKSTTVFDIGSITKQFTAAGILKLEEQGKLSVNDKITNYFKNVPISKENITLHHLLTHSSGLPPAIGHDYHIISKPDFIDKSLSSDLLFTVGTGYEYSNVGYTLLAMVIEEVSGQSYENFLYDHLWNPSQMEQTGYIRPKFDQSNVAVGYRDSGKWGKPNEKWDDGISWHLKGNGGILSTVEDMYKWHQALLGNTILSQASKSKMYTKHIEEGQGAQSHYGYGWAIFPTPRNTELIAHNGGNGIFFADFWRYLDEDITIIMMTNHANRGYDMLTSQLAGIILKPNFEPNSELRQSQADAQSERQMEQILDSFLDVIKKDDATGWETFIRHNFSKEMIDFMPMDEHLAMFKKMHNELKNQTVNGVMLNENDDIEIKFDENTLVISMEKEPNAKVKIGGLMLD
ncbi:serine hydrolase domain-containing protein [Psychroserpens luteolus]|uniref:serine hydrolase domain-containing protein n=1 Tax=Psychroserpens luteolus TaxID=2855840 RepID=UPI001E528157|nr:serine hydrolase domain-containing protein [Psychroserpens luteolus]MCD2259199.1 beta-lactamase family protein [Psychroserpens luteolus]